MKIKLAVAIGALALVGVGAIALASRREPATTVQRSRHASVASAPVVVEAPAASRGEKRVEEKKPAGTDQAKPLPRAGVRSDAQALDLMAAPAKEQMPELRKAFLSATDAKERLRLAHILIAQNRRFGMAIEIDREVQAFLESVLADPEKDHASAISALARWETEESFGTLGRVLANPEEQNDYAKAAEWLSESRNPKAAATILEAFQGTDDEDGKIVAANALLKIACETPELGLASVLRGQVRPELEKILARTDSEWTRTSVAKLIEALP